MEQYLDETYLFTYTEILIIHFKSTCNIRGTVVSELEFTFTS